MIYKFNPILRPMIWGSELWVLSGYGERISRVSEGPDTGKTVNEVYGKEFPLLIKFIDAHEDLSIQVHPGEEMAQRIHNDHGKTEMWYVIGASEGAHLYSGLKRKITPEEYVDLVKKNRIVDVLADHKLQSGDVFFLPAGRIHAICGGTYLAEIQQTSDLTYRIYDYNRPGPDGKPRALHTELAKEAIDYNVYPDYRTHYERKPGTEVQLESCEYFTTSLLELDGSYDGCRRDMQIVVCMEGFAMANGKGLKKNETILLLDETLKITGTGKFLTVHI